MHFKSDNYYEQTFSSLALHGEKAPEKIFENCVFEKCQLVDCSFEKSKFLDCRFQECVISAVDLHNCRITEPSFKQCKIMGIDWTKIDLLREPIFEKCQLSMSNFRMLKLSKVRMTDCEVREVDFGETEMKEAVLTGSNFETSRFFKTALTNADFRKARNYEIDITTCKITGAKFSYPEVVSLLKGLEIIIE